MLFCRRYSLLLIFLPCYRRANQACTEEALLLRESENPPAWRKAAYDRARIAVKITVPANVGRDEFAADCVHRHTPVRANPSPSKASSRLPTPQSTDKALSLGVPYLAQHSVGGLLHQDGSCGDCDGAGSHCRPFLGHRRVGTCGPRRAAPVAPARSAGRSIGGLEGVCACSSFSSAAT